MPDHVTVSLAVNSPVVCEALREGASAIQLEEIDREKSAEGVFGFSLERRKRRIALATTLDEQLEAGRAVVDVPVEVADGVARRVAEVIREELGALMCDPYDMAPRGAILKRAAGLMQMLVALDAAIEGLVMPAGRPEAHTPGLLSPRRLTT